VDRPKLKQFIQILLPIKHYFFIINIISLISGEKKLLLREPNEACKEIMPIIMRNN